MWLAPSPLWETATAGIDQPAFEQPVIVELHDDDFVATFLGLMAGEGDGPGGIGELAPTDGDGTFPAR